jgi:hypothetical protein
MYITNVKIIFNLRLILLKIKQKMKILISIKKRINLKSFALLPETYAPFDPIIDDVI